MVSSLTKFIFLFCTLLLGLNTNLQAATKDATIVVRNVTLPDADATDLTVNIVLINGILDLVTEDTIELDSVDQLFDAANGVIIGQLDVGRPAGFLILREDPRDNVEALLDTKTYSSFVVYKGKIVKNNYARVMAKTEQEKKKEKQGWLAYTPPPLARSSSYADKSKWNRFDSKVVNAIFAGAIVLDRTVFLAQNTDSKFQVGDLDGLSGGEIRALRFGTVGTLNFKKPWVYTLFGATHAFDKGFDQRESDDFSLFDVRLDIPIFDVASFSIGKQKEPISMERTMSMIDLPMQERSMSSDGLLPSRNTGVVIAGNLFSNRVSLAGGVFNDFLDKDQPNSPSNNSTQAVGRLTWVPFKSENESTLLHLGMGLRQSNIREGVSIKTTPEINLAPTFIDSGFIDPMYLDESNNINLEASLRSGPFWVHAEYNRVNLHAPALLDPEITGYHVTLSWIATGEVRDYNAKNGTFRSVPISRSVEQNGWGAWEYSVRYSTLDANDGLLLGGDADVWSFGINWWLTDLMNININYRYIDLVKDGLDGTNSGITSRIVLVLE